MGFYDDVHAVGGLGHAVQQALRAVGSCVTVPEEELPEGWVSIEAHDRDVNILKSAERRLFIVHFWQHGVELARGTTDDIRELARTIDAWHQGRATPQQLAERFPFVQVGERAETVGKLEDVEDAWQSIAQHRPDLAPFIVEAASHPQLRQLYPYTSMWSLCLSQSTGVPFTKGLPVITPKSGTYEVKMAGKGTLGRGDARETVRLVLENLPRDCGPAAYGA